jgi:hypothetical protein
LAPCRSGYGKQVDTEVVDMISRGGPAGPRLAGLEPQDTLRWLEDWCERWQAAGQQRCPDWGQLWVQVQELNTVLQGPLEDSNELAWRSGVSGVLRVSSHLLSRSSAGLRWSRHRCPPH